MRLRSFLPLNRLRVALRVSTLGSAFGSVLALTLTTGGGCTPLKSSDPALDGGAGATDAGADAVDSPFRVVRDKPDGGALRAIWGEGAEVYVVGESGTALRFEGAAEPSETVMGTGVDLNSVWGSSVQEIYAVGTQRNTNRGVIFRRTLGRWIQIGTAPHGLRAVWGMLGTRYAIGNDGVIYSGTEPQPFGVGTQVEPPEGVPATLFSPVLYSIAGNNENSIMIAGDVNARYFFDGTWRLYADPQDRTRAFRAVFAPPGPNIDIYQGANYYGLWHFTGAANPVVQVNEEKDVPQKLERSIWSIWGPSGDKIIAVGDAGRIMTYDKATQKVTIVPAPTGRNLYAVWGTSLDDVWIAGEGQLLLRGALKF